MRAAAFASILVLALVHVAAADPVTAAIKKVRSNTSSGVRVAAEIDLARTGDARGIPVLADALRNDRDEHVRQVAAIGLRKLVTSASSSSDLQLALAALDQASKQDALRSVRRAAKRSFDKLHPLLATSTSTYVDIGSVTVPQAHSVITPSLRHTIARQVRKQPGMQSMSQGAGFHLEVAVMSVSQPQSSGPLSCEVQIILTDFPVTKRLGSALGRASVAPSGQGTTNAAASDCVDAVTESLLINNVFPLITKQATAKAATTTTSQTSSTSTASRAASTTQTDTTTQ